MITTGDSGIAELLRKLRVHGEEQRYIHRYVGTNSRLDELQAAILRIKFKYLNEWNRKRIDHAAFYSEELRDLPLELPQVDPSNTPTFHQFVIKTEKRQALRSTLTDKKIGTGIYYPLPLPLQPCFSYLGYKPGDFPNAERCSSASLALPIYPELTTEQLRYVVAGIRSFFE